MSTLEEIKRIIARIAHCSPDEINLGTALKDIKADSLHWVQIIVAAENTFNIEIDIDRMKDFTTIEDLVKHIESCVK